MFLRANYNEMESISQDVLADAGKLDETFKEMITLIESIKTCWTGPDSLNFINNSTTYIKNINNNVNEIRDLSKFVSQVSLAYSGKDTEWRSRVRRVGAKDE